MLLKYLKFLKFPANMTKAIFYSRILNLMNIKLGKSTFSSTKLSSHISNAKFSRNQRVQSARLIQPCDFALLFLSRSLVPSFNTCSRGNSIRKSYVVDWELLESRSRVYPSLFDDRNRWNKVDSPTWPKNTSRSGTNFKIPRRICNSKRYVHVDR